jgi:sulfur-oxidizing protein SoxY
MSQQQTIHLSRRKLFQQAGLLGLTALATGSALPRALHAEETPPPPSDAAAPAETVDMDKVIAEKMGEGAITMEKVDADLPGTAENGALVRCPITVDHPMEPDNFIESVGIFVDNNPRPFVAKFNFSPSCGAAKFEVRMKMAKASDVRIIARSNKGALYGLKKKVIVAEGGCAG